MSASHISTTPRDLTVVAARLEPKGAQYIEAPEVLALQCGVEKHQGVFEAISRHNGLDIRPGTREPLMMIALRDHLGFDQDEPNRLPAVKELGSGLVPSPASEQAHRAHGTRGKTDSQRSPKRCAQFARLKVAVTKNYAELSEQAFRSARAAVIAAALAPVLPPLGLIAIRASFGTAPPVIAIATMLAAWCSVAGGVFVLFLARLQGDERRVNRAPAAIYSLTLWLASSFAAAVLTGGGWVALGMR